MIREFYETEYRNIKHLVIPNEVGVKANLNFILDSLDHYYSGVRKIIEYNKEKGTDLMGENYEEVVKIVGFNENIITSLKGKDTLPAGYYFYGYIKDKYEKLIYKVVTKENLVAIKNEIREEFNRLPTEVIADMKAVTFSFLSLKDLAETTEDYINDNKDKIEILKPYKDKVYLQMVIRNDPTVTKETTLISNIIEYSMTYNFCFHTEKLTLSCSRVEFNSELENYNELEKIYKTILFYENPKVLTFYSVHDNFGVVEELLDCLFIEGVTTTKDEMINEIKNAINYFALKKEDKFNSKYFIRC